MKKLVSILLTVAVAVSLFVVPAVASGDGAPTIDGVLGADEWGSPNFFGSNYNVYVFNDTDYLYVAFEANCGNYTIASSMTNIYIYRGTDYAGECWAYTVAGWVGDVGLDHFTTHHIQPPKVKEGKEAWPTSAIVSIAPTVMEWRIPLSELPMSPGDPIAFDFMSYSEGCSTWPTAWLYEQYYTLVSPVIEVDIDIKPGSDPNSINLKSKGVVPVAVLTTDDFDASNVDPSTVKFAGAAPVRWTMEDVDGDGDMDMLFHFKTQELDLDENSTEATLSGETIDGTPIEGTDTVNIVPKGK